MTSQQLCAKNYMNEETSCPKCQSSEVIRNEKVNNARNNDMYAKYAEEAAKMPNLIRGGRLGAYHYWDMDKAIVDALNVFETKILPAGVRS